MRIEEAIGPVDILVNNAEMQFRMPLEEFPAEKWEELLKTNVSSAFYVGQAVARHMTLRGSGKILYIASVQSELLQQSSVRRSILCGPLRGTRGNVYYIPYEFATSRSR